MIKGISNLSDFSFILTLLELLLGITEKFTVQTVKAFQKLTSKAEKHLHIAKHPNIFQSSKVDSSTFHQKDG